MRRTSAMIVAAILFLAPPGSVAASDTEAVLREARDLAATAGPGAALGRLREATEAATARGVPDTDLRALLAEALVQAQNAKDTQAAVALGARSLAAARAGGTAAERATALNDYAAALDAAGRTEQAKDLYAEALALIERQPDAIPVMDRVVFYSNLSAVTRRAGDGAAATAHALAAAELLLTVDLPHAAADAWVKTLLRFGREATVAKDPKARDLRIAVIRFASKTGTGEPASALKSALDNAVAVCGERPELARDLVIDTINGPLFRPWLAAHRRAFVESLDFAASKWGLTGALATGEESRRIRRPLLDLLESALVLLAGPDGAMPPEAEMLLRRALYTGLVTRDYGRAETSGLKAIALLEAQPNRDAAALADAFATLGELYQETDRYPEARAILDRAIASARVTGDRNALRSALSSLASIERKIGTPATAAAAWGALLAELDPSGIEVERDGNPLVAAMGRQLGVEAAHAWVARSLALEDLGRVDEAEFGYRRSLEISKRAGDTTTFAINAVYLIQHDRHLGRLTEAATLAADVIAMVGRDASPTMLLSLEANVMVAKARLLPPGEDRARLLTEAADLVETAERRRAGLAGDLVAMERSDDLRLIAEVERMSGRAEKARTIYEALIAEERAQQPIRPARLSLFLLDRAVLDIEDGRAEAALGDLAEAEALSPATAGDALAAGTRASILTIRSQATSRLGRRGEALVAAREAADLARIVVTAAEDARAASGEETRKKMAHVFQNAVRATWRSRP